MATIINCSTPTKANDDLMKYYWESWNFSGIDMDQLLSINLMGNIDVFIFVMLTVFIFSDNHFDHGVCLYALGHTSNCSYDTQKQK